MSIEVDAEPAREPLSVAEQARALELAQELGAQAGALLLEGFRTGAAIRHKGRIDLVTEFDLRSEALIREGIRAAFPSHRIVGEEGEAEGEGELVWYVDPLDGTTNFAHGHPFFCVSIALWEGGTPKVGLVAAPALGLRWCAQAGGGAFRAQTQGEGHPSSPCHVSAITTLEASLGATGFPYDKWANPDRNVREFEAFLTRTQGIRRCGSAALDLALVADGTYDFYWEDRLSAWDLCAGAALVLEAGGRLSGLEGEPADARGGQLVASNGALHEPVLAVLRGARAAG